MFVRIAKLNGRGDANSLGPRAFEEYSAFTDSPEDDGHKHVNAKS
jgi:hypothetical protein